MAIGFEVHNFRVLNAFRGPDVDALKKCCRGGTNLVFLKDRDQLWDGVSVKHLIAIYHYFTGNIMKHPEAGEEDSWKKDSIPIIRQSFDDKKIKDAKTYVKPATLSEEGEKPKEPKTEKPKKAAPEKVKPEEATPQPETKEKEKTHMASKKKATKKTTSKKTTSKKTTKKAPAKKAAADGAKRGRKGPYSLTDKIYPLVKENPCHPTFNGKPGERHANLEIILKKPGITVEDFLKKGGTMHHLTGLAIRHKPPYARVGSK